MAYRSNRFTMLPIDRIRSLKETYLQCLEKIAQLQNYSIDGRSFTRANLSEVRDTIMELEDAEARYMAARRGLVANRSLASFRRYTR